jgi:hypothetical protein
VIDKFTTISNYFSKEISMNTPLFLAVKMCARFEDFPND